MDKGTRVKVVRGRKGVGKTGVIFWIGENKYGDGKRIGLEGDDGETYWIPMDDVEETSEVAATTHVGPEASKGSKVKWGPEGEESYGTVFWFGAAKNGRGNRIGVNDQHGETHWFNTKQVTVIDDLPEVAEPEPAPAADMPDMPDGPSWDHAPDYGDEDQDAPVPASGVESTWDDDDPPF